MQINKVTKVNGTMLAIQKKVRQTLLGSTLLFTLGCSQMATAQHADQIAPSYPLITHTPYFSIWSNKDILTDGSTVHWTGKPQSLIGIIKVDNEFYRFMGKEVKAYNSVAPAGDENDHVQIHYTTQNPGENWQAVQADTNGWQSGLLPISDDSKTARTLWSTDDIWIRRTFQYNGGNTDGLKIKLKHDDNIVLYLNGHELYQKEGWVEDFLYSDFNDRLKKYLIKGKNVLAAHVKNTAGGRYFDIGLSKELHSVYNSPIAIAKQKSTQIEAMQTIYQFECGHTNLKLTFTSPLLLQHLDILTRPISYITYQVSSTDGKPHHATVLLSASSDIAVNTPNQQVQAETLNNKDLSLLKVGTLEQPILGKKGDDVRIDWGYFYVGAATKHAKQSLSQNTFEGIESFLNGNLSNNNLKISGKQLSLNTAVDLGTTDANNFATGHMVLGYDEQFAIQYFHTNLRPWWNRDGKQNFADLMQKASKEYNQVMTLVKKEDQRIRQELLMAGGADYARLSILAYRQSIAAHNIVQSPQNELLFLSKENFSNGSINTVDLTYPSAPLYLMYNTELLKGMMRGIFYYSESGKWTKPYSAHDLGTYPIANGQTYGEDMPVEEAGNMVILAAAIAKVDGNANFAKEHWKTISIWADYLAKAGFDPANQLCTDDFAGHLARNVNLSAKAIMAIRSYGYLAEQLGEKATAKKYIALAKSMVPKWMALADDGDHYSLSFENKGSWSQKYNLVWDKVLDFNIFPPQVYQKEVNYYLKQQNRYGVPLDSRKSYTKSDWIMWTATMTNNRQDFESFMHPLIRYIKETPSRVPLSDWHDTKDGRQQNFQARSVVGGYFMQSFNYWLHHKK